MLNVRHPSSKQACVKPTDPVNPPIDQETSLCHEPPPTSIDTEVKPLQSTGY